MKKIISAVLVCVVVLLCSCTGKKVFLQLNLRENEIIRTRVTTEQHITQPGRDSDVDVKQTIIFDYTYEITSITKEGNYAISATYEEIGYTMENLLGTFTYKSWEDPDDVPLIAQGIAGMVGQNFKFEITPKGRVVNIMGVDQVLEKILDDFKDRFDAETMSMYEENLKNQYGDQALRENIERMFAVFPDKPVGKGDSWETVLTLTKGFPMVMCNEMKITGIKEGCAYIDVLTEIEPNEEATMIQLGDMKMAYELVGEQKGYIVIDTLTGWVVESEMEQLMRGVIHFASETYGEMEWPIRVKETVTVGQIE